MERRRESVASLAARGFSERQIAEGLQRNYPGVTASTVHDDLVAVRPRLRRPLEDTAKDIYADAAAELAEVRREMWFNYARTPESQVGLRLSILNSIAALPSRRVEIGQRLGLVVQAPERVEIVQGIQRDLTDALMRMPEGDRVAAEILRLRKP